MTTPSSCDHTSTSHDHTSIPHDHTTSHDHTSTSHDHTSTSHDHTSISHDHTSISHDHTHKVSRGDFVESNKLLIAALDIRRKYMKIGSMSFCKTTGNVMDGNPPPSSVFCIPDTSGKIYLTKNGDILPGK